MFQDGISSIEGDLVISLVTVGKSKIVVEALNLYSNKKQQSAIYTPILSFGSRLKKWMAGHQPLAISQFENSFKLFQTIPLGMERSEFPWFFPRWCESSHHHQGRQLGVQLQSSFQFHLTEFKKIVNNTDNNKHMSALAPWYLKNESADSDVKS